MYVCMYLQRMCEDETRDLEKEEMSEVVQAMVRVWRKYKALVVLCYHLVQVMHDKDEHVPASS